VSEEIHSNGLGKNKPHSAAPNQTRKKTGAGTYLFALFAIAFLLLLMAYFMQERADASTVNPTVSPATQQVQAEVSSLLDGLYIIN